MKNQKPERREWEDVSAMKMKCGPGGKSLIPEKVWGALGVVRVRRSIPKRLEGGRFARSRVGVGGDMGMGIICCRQSLERIAPGVCLESISKIDEQRAGG